MIFNSKINVKDTWDWTNGAFLNGSRVPYTFAIMLQHPRPITNPDRYERGDVCFHGNVHKHLDSDTSK